MEAEQGLNGEKGRMNNKNLGLALFKNLIRCI